MVGRPKEGTGHPTLQTARSLAKRYGLERCVVFFVKGDRFGYASYGKDEATCEDTRRMADAMYEVAEAHLSPKPELLEGDFDDALELLDHLRHST